MNYFDIAKLMKSNHTRVRSMLCCSLLVLTGLGLVACGEKEKKSSQTLARVNGEEITLLQLNEELLRSGVPAGQQDAARKQLLAALVDRQLLENEAVKEKIDRDPQVLQAVERAKALILAQAYMQKRIGNTARPTQAAARTYFDQHPEFFTRRKQFDMRELVLATADMNDALKAELDSAKSLDEVAVWLDQHKIKYARAELARNSSELPPEMTAKLVAMPKGQLFIIKEGARSMLISVADIKDSPVALEQAEPQIEQFLFNKANKDASEAELARLRAAAKIEYPNAADAPSVGTAAVSPSVAPAAASTPAPAPADASAVANDRGVAGLK